MLAAAIPAPAVVVCNIFARGIANCRVLVVDAALIIVILLLPYRNCEASAPHGQHLKFHTALNVHTIPSYPKVG